MLAAGRIMRKAGRGVPVMSPVNVSERAHMLKVTHAPIVNLCARTVLLDVCRAKRSRSSSGHGMC